MPELMSLIETRPTKLLPSAWFMRPSTGRCSTMQWRWPGGLRPSLPQGLANERTLFMDLAVSDDGHRLMSEFVAGKRTIRD